MADRVPESSFPDQPTAHRLSLHLEDGDMASVRLIEDELGERYVTVSASVPVNLRSDELRHLADAMEAWPEEIDP